MREIDRGQGWCRLGVWLLLGEWGCESHLKGC